MQSKNQRSKQKKKGNTKAMKHSDKNRKLKKKKRFSNRVVSISRLFLMLKGSGYRIIKIEEKDNSKMIFFVLLFSEHFKDKVKVEKQTDDCSKNTLNFAKKRYSQ